MIWLLLSLSPLLRLSFFLLLFTVTLLLLLLPLTRSLQGLLGVSLTWLLLSFRLPQLPPCRYVTMHESARDASSKVFIEQADVWKQRTQKRGGWRPHLQAYGVDGVLGAAAVCNMWFNRRGGGPGGEEGQEQGGDPEDERDERISGPEERYARCDERERD